MSLKSLWQRKVIEKQTKDHAVLVTGQRRVDHAFEHQWVLRMDIAFEGRDYQAEYQRHELALCEIASNQLINVQEMEMHRGPGPHRPMCSQCMNARRLLKELRR